MNMNSHGLRRQHGLTLLEMLAALAVSTMVLTGLVFWIDSGLEDTKGQQAALYQSRFAGGIKKFIADPTWGAYIRANATTTVPVKVQVANLTAADYLPAGTVASNSYGQTPCALIYYDSVKNRIDALVTTEGGRAIPEKQLGYVAANAGDGAGYISTTTPTLAKGAFGAWQTTLANYTDASAGKNCTGTPATGGRLATMIFQEATGTLQSDFLYRDAVPGRPDLNTMNTPIIMGAGTIQTEGNACTDNGAIGRDATGSVVSCVSLIWKKAGGSAYWADPVANFATLLTNTCGAAEAGQTRVVRAPTVGTGPRAYTCNGAGSWQPLALDDSGNLTISGTATINALNGNLQVTATAADNTACVGEGRLARSTVTSGLILSCQSSVWKKATGGGGTGLSGILEPLNGRTISCAFYDYGYKKTISGYSMISNGVFYTRLIVSGRGDTGWLAGNVAYWIDPQSGEAVFSAGTSGLSGLVVSANYGCTYPGPCQCMASWPLT